MTFGTFLLLGGIFCQWFSLLAVNGPLRPALLVLLQCTQPWHKKYLIQCTQRRLEKYKDSSKDCQINRDLCLSQVFIINLSKKTNMKMLIKFVQDFGFLGITWPGILCELRLWLSWGVFWYRICIYPQLMFQNTPRLKRLVSRPSGSVDLIPTLRSSSQKLVDVHDESVMTMKINIKYCVRYFVKNSNTKTPSNLVKKLE